MGIILLLTLLVLLDVLALRYGADTRPGFEVFPRNKSMTGAGLTLGPRRR
jgi:hypothetical protein